MNTVRRSFAVLAISAMATLGAVTTAGSASAASCTFHSNSTQAGVSCTGFAGGYAIEVKCRYEGNAVPVWVRGPMKTSGISWQGCGPAGSMLDKRSYGAVKGTW